MKKGIYLFGCVTCFLLLGKTIFASAQNQQVTVDIDKGAVNFSIQGETAAVYHYKGFPKPILYPVYAPGNIPMTRSYPIEKGKKGESDDHPHHQSIWFCHGDVIPKGIDYKSTKGVEGVDFWSLHNDHGKIVCTSVKKGSSGKFWNSIDTTNEWRDAEGRKIMDEKRTITLYNFGKARLWVFDIDLHASVCPIVFGDTKEGSMALRVNDTITERNGNGQLQNADGLKTMAQCWGMHSAWVDYSGTISGQKVGIAIFDDPDNPHPAAWHARNYGLLTANPFGRQKSRFPAVKDNTDLVELEKGQHLVLRYGILVHQGGTQDGNVAGYYQRYLALGKKKQ